MRDWAQAILDQVLRSIADDYESLDIILETINRWGLDPDIEPWPALSVIPVSQPEVIKALRELTREGYAQSYILNSSEPHAVPVEYRSDDVEDLWFYVTPKGLRAVKLLNGDTISNS